MLGQWSEIDRLLASDGAAGDSFGASVSICGDTIVIGAANDDDSGTDSGSAYVFQWNESDWVQVAKLLPSDGAWTSYFGCAVSISGDTVVVGALGDEDAAFMAGSAYVFTRPTSGWSGTCYESAKLLASDGVMLDMLGVSVSVSGETIVVGADGSSNDAVYVFEEPIYGWLGTLYEDARLYASDGGASDTLGSSVFISGETDRGRRAVQ